MADATCSIDGCERAVKARGWCLKHYKRWRNHGDPMAGRRYDWPETCSIVGCHEPAKSRGWCKSHWRRWKNHGNPLAGGTRATPGDPQLFIALASRYTGDQCLLWPYAQIGNGYGHVKIDGETTTAHRAVLHATAGPPPAPDMVAAHAPLICHNPLCVNPSHLRWATQAENVHDTTIDGTAHWLRT